MLYYSQSCYLVDQTFSVKGSKLTIYNKSVQIQSKYINKKQRALTKKRKEKETACLIHFWYLSNFLRN